MKDDPAPDDIPSSRRVPAERTDAGEGVVEYTDPHAQSRPSVGPRPPTLKDVADRAGVSLKTVSRIVNREEGVSLAMRQQVEEVIATLGYRRNVAARSLRTGHRIGSIGLAVADLVNPFSAAVAKAVESVARRNDAVVIIGSSEEDPRRERQLVSDLLRHPVDGLIMVPTGNDHRYLEPERRMGARIVFLDRAAGMIEGDAVVLDNVGGARRAVEHLLRHGHHRIGFVGDAQWVHTALERLEGYQLALSEAGIPYNPGLVRMTSSPPEGAEVAARELVTSDDPATAIFASNNQHCVGVLRGARVSPRQIAVVGFDDFEFADLLPVPVSVIAYDPAELGRAAGELLFSRLAGDSRPPQRIVIPTRLIQRGSGELRA